MSGVGLLVRPEPVVHQNPHTGTPAWQAEPITTRSPHLTALFERVQLGDRDAFAELYDAIAATVFGAVKRVVRDPAMSEEVTQEVFVELWTSASRFEPERGSVATWALTIARRRAIDRVRAEQSQRNRIDQLGQRRQPSETAADDQVVASIAARQVADALAELPPDQRQVIRLAFLDGLSHADIADRLDLPLGTVKGRVRGGLQKLSVKLGGLA